jgi:hypothetical protein
MEYKLWQFIFEVYNTVLFNMHHIKGGALIVLHKLELL